MIDRGKFGVPTVSEQQVKHQGGRLGGRPGRDNSDSPNNHLPITPDLHTMINVK